MKRKLSYTLLLVVTYAAACSTGPLDGAADVSSETQAVLQTRGPLPESSDLSTPPNASLFLGPEWQQYQQGPLYLGGEVQLSVDPSRFPTCGTLGTVTAFLRAEDGQVTEVVLDQGEPGEYRWGASWLPVQGGTLEIWLRSSRDDGCEEWDSRFGENYRFDLTPWRPVRMVFAADWTETVAAEGGLRAGDTLIIDYDFGRLPDCRVIYRGFPGWDIVAHLRIDGKEVISQSLVGRPDPPTVTRQLGVIPIPLGARRIELWFENSQYPPTCQAWDSDFGRNYPVDLIP